MSRTKRIQLIEKIEKKRKSRVICYLTGDRRGFETRIHPEIQTILYEHLMGMGEVENIDLLLYTTGGVTMAAWGIVNLIREFCKKFSVIIPFKAWSTGTLIGLGANEIIMGKLGQLGPVDPSVTTAFNPTRPSPAGSPGKILPISVEEVAGYISLAKDKELTNIKAEAELTQVFKQLSDKVHPLALGNVYRAKEQIKILSKKLLAFHMDQKEEEKEIDKIVSLLTRDLYSHDYTISRREASEEIGLKVQDPQHIDKNFEKLIYDLFKLYADELDLNNPFNQDVFVGGEESKVGVFARAFVESTVKCNVFITEKKISRMSHTRPDISVALPGFVENIIREGWEQQKSPKK